LEDRGRRYRKLIRLPHEIYDEPGGIWLLTTVADGRAPHFADRAFAAAVCQSLELVCRDANANLLAYALMPDHLHAIMLTTSTNVMAIMQRFKSYTAHVRKKQTGHPKLWQDSFYDEGIRGAQDLDRAVRYVLENPVRAQLVEEWEMWPFTGGSLVTGPEPDSA
jgi:putative transposase